MVITSASSLRPAPRRDIVKRSSRPVEESIEEQPPQYGLGPTPPYYHTHEMNHVTSGQIEMIVIGIDDREEKVGPEWIT
ncbi:hypothetical protein Aduo_016777 [Ancylostoma duodenale]